MSDFWKGWMIGTVFSLVMVVLWTLTFRGLA